MTLVVSKKSGGNERVASFAKNAIIHVTNVGPPFLKDDERKGF